MDAQSNTENLIDSNIIQGIKFPFEQNVSLGRHLLDCLRSHEDGVAQIDIRTEKVLTFHQLKTQSIQLAMYLRDREIGHGDIVSICLYNTFESTIALFAALYNGSIIATLDPTLSKPEFKHLLSIGKPKIIFTELYCLKLIAEAIEELDLNTEIVIGRYESDPNIKMANISQLLMQTINEDEFQPVDFSNPHDEIAVVLPSSGTTGLPKGVTLSHGALLMQLQIMRLAGVPRGSSMFSASTFYWISGLLMTFICVDQYGKKLLLSPFDAQLLLQAIDKYKINVFFFGVANFSEIVAEAIRNSYDLSSVRIISVTGAKASEKQLQHVKDIFKNGTCNSGYGLTEVAGLCFNILNFKPNSMGRVAAGLEAKIIDLKTGRSLGPDSNGELCIRGKVVMKYYWNNEEETMKVLDKDGWLHTGDLCYYDEDNCFYFVDRIKDIFKCRGWKISPFELESHLMECPGVKDVAVIGVPHEVDVTRARAFIVKEDNVNLTEEDIQNHIRDRLNANKQITGGIVFINALPRTITGKVAKKSLSKL